MLFCVALLISLGQLATKLFVSEVTYISTIMGFLLNKYFIGLISAYGIASIIWFYCLFKMDLSKAYPMIGITFILLPLFSYLVLDEKISRYTIFGAFLIFMGVYISYLKD